ncbi:MAG: HAD family hydrolase [Firmicutes bacterium]|nr:HAD family hydrolase [Bacillota bacterium]
MIRGLLLDLDNTLIQVDVDAFVERYARAVARRLMPEDPERGMAVVAGASYRLLAERSPKERNRDRLLRALAAELGEEPRALWTRLESVAAEVLPALRPLVRPLPGAREVVAEARRRGLRLALATNPIYPRRVIVERMRWSGLGEEDVDHVACLEASSATKPDPAYFAELAAALGLEEEECLMVGDDPDQDVPEGESALHVHLLAPADGEAGRGRVRRGPLASLWRVWDDLLPGAVAGAREEGGARA